MSELVDVLLASDQAEGTRSQVLLWLKAVGDQVSENEPLLEIETDKVTVEIPAPCAGVLCEILKQAETEVEPGSVLGRIDRTANIGANVQQSHRQVPDAGARAEAPPRQAATSATAGPLSPAVRRLLIAHHLEAGEIEGSGANGKITVEDVLRHAGSNAPRAPTTAPQSTASQPQGALQGRLVAHSRMRLQIAERMVASLLHTAPHVTTVFEVDLSAVLAHRTQWRADFEGRGAALTLTSYFLAACVSALQAVPELNSRWRPGGLELYEHIDIGVATALENGGLVVPVIRNVAALDLFDIARELGDRVLRAREDRLVPADVRGGTFTVSNHGVSGSLLAAPIIIHQPQSAILGIGKVEKRPVVTVEGGRDVVAIRSRCYVTLTIDHRVLDGQRANQFLGVLTRRLEQWGSEH
ncbi:MAG TPA: 2-oxo acid dehydrogenase subunit E2 [Steroidobacteraceae bacterium]|nr:2-oxo acid dehydrogenase subunit E2 [Steroidobacteraceae bacterium]